MKTFALTAAALGLAVSAVPAMAAPQETESMTVSVRGLDLGTVEGQEMLDKRIERAAKSVCGVGNVRTGTLTQAFAAKKCLAKARASAKRQTAAIVAQQRRGG